MGRTLIKRNSSRTNMPVRSQQLANHENHPDASLATKRGRSPGKNVPIFGASGNQRGNARTGHKAGSRSALNGLVIGVLALLVSFAICHFLPPNLHVFGKLLLFAVPSGVACWIGGVTPGAIIAALSVYAATRVLHAATGINIALDEIILSLAGLSIAGLARTVRSKASDHDFLMSCFRAVLEVDRTGIVIMTRSGRVLHASQEAERIGGAALHEQGLGQSSSVKMTRADGSRISVLDLIVDTNDAAASSGRKSFTLLTGSNPREMVISQDNSARTWVEYRALPIRTGGRSAAALALLFWDTQAKRRVEASARSSDEQRRRREETEAMFSRLGKEFRGSLDSHHLQITAASELAQLLRADRCFFLVFPNNGDGGSQKAVFGPQWNAPHVAPLQADYDEIEMDAPRLYRSAETVASHDLRSSTLPSAVVDSLERIGVRSCISVPIFDGDIATASLTVAMSGSPRAWSADEVQIVEAVASQARFAMEAARLLMVESRRAAQAEMIGRIHATVLSAADTDEIQGEATRTLGQAVDADRCYFVRYEDRDGELTAIVGRDYVRAHGMAPLAGTHPLDEPPAGIAQLMHSRGSLVVDDTEADQLQAVQLAQIRGELVRSFIRVPIFFQEQPIAAMVLTMVEAPRQWAAEEVSLAESVAAITGSAISNAILSEREKRRVERDTHIERISEGLRDAEDLPAAQLVVAGALGGALHADRCYVLSFDSHDPSAYVLTDYHREGLGDVSGRYGLEDSSIAWLAQMAMSGKPASIPDITTRKFKPFVAAGFLADFKHRSLLIVPQLTNGRLTDMLIVAMADRVRDWSPSDISLARDAADRLQSAAFRLLPAAEEEPASTAEVVEVVADVGLTTTQFPETAGLKLASAFASASDSQAAGGDFIDVFEIDEHRTAICVVDLSSKGADANREWTTVKGMLRAALYDGEPLKESMSALNSRIILHGIIAGFATAFVAVYDQMHNRLAYVSCGHEPVLLLRAAGGNPRILAPTAPALGIGEQSVIEEGSVTLAPGDLALIYTDGVLEAGRGKSTPLGIAGLAEAVMQAVSSFPRDDTLAILTDISGRIDKHSQGEIIDDICMLLMTAT